MIVCAPFHHSIPGEKEKGSPFGKNKIVTANVNV